MAPLAPQDTANGAQAADKQRPQVPQARSVAAADIANGSDGIDDPAFRDYVRERSRALLRTA